MVLNSNDTKSGHCCLHGDTWNTVTSVCELILINNCKSSYIDQKQNCEECKSGFNFDVHQKDPQSKPNVCCGDNTYWNTTDNTCTVLMDLKLKTEECGVWDVTRWSCKTCANGKYRSEVNATLNVECCDEKFWFNTTSETCVAVDEAVDKNEFCLQVDSTTQTAPFPCSKCMEETTDTTPLKIHKSLMVNTLCCKEGFWAPADSTQCVAFPANCAEVDEEKAICTKCSTGYWAIDLTSAKYDTVGS